MEGRLNAGGSLTADLEEEAAAQSTHVSTLGPRLNTTENTAELLMTGLKVAFSAGLSRSMGPLTSTATAICDTLFTSTGLAYTPNTGVFTAPVRGVYYTTCIYTAYIYYISILYKDSIGTAWLYVGKKTKTEPFCLTTLM